MAVTDTLFVEMGGDGNFVIPKTYTITKLGYSNDVFDLEPVLIQPAYIQCAEPSDMEIVQALKGEGRLMI